MFEVSVVILILCIGIKLSLIQWHATREKLQLQLTVDQFISAIEYAKAQAILYQQPIVLCATSSVQRCESTSHTQYLVGIAEGTQSISKLLRIFPEIDTKIRMNWRLFQPNNDQFRIHLLPSGWVTNGSVVFFQSADPGALAITVRLNVLGRVEVTH